MASKKEKREYFANQNKKISTIKDLHTVKPIISDNNKPRENKVWKTNLHLPLHKFTFPWNRFQVSLKSGKL